MQRRFAAAGIFRTESGRLRLGLRLVLFVLLALMIALAIVLVLPSGPVAQSAALLVGSVLAGAILVRQDGRGAGALGFHLSPGALVEGGSGVALGVAVAVVVVAAIAAGGGIAWSPRPGTLLGWVSGAVGALLFLALPAAAEEAFLRGYPLQALAEAWGPAAGLVITSAVFGAMHLANPGVTAIGTLNVAAAGVFLGVVYLKTLSLWWASGAHLGWNWAHGYLADVPVSGLELLDAPFYDGLMRGPAWLGGAGFGPEGSLVATVVVGLAAALCWRARWLRPSEAALAARPLAARGSERGAGDPREPRVGSGSAA